MRITEKNGDFYKLKKGNEIYGEEDGIRLVQIVGQHEDLEELNENTEYEIAEYEGQYVITKEGYQDFVKKQEAINILKEKFDFNFFEVIDKSTTFYMSIANKSNPNYRTKTVKINNKKDYDLLVEVLDNGKHEGLENGNKES